jgi:hypothetical protein
MPAPGALRRWWDSEVSRIQVERPRLSRVLHAVAQRPVPVLCTLAVLICGLLGAVIPEGDAKLFRDAGAGMWGSRVFDVFAEPALQIGPLYLAALGGVYRLCEALGLPALFMVSALQASGVAWFGLWTARRVARVTREPVLPAQWALGLVFVLGGFLAEGVGNGHLEEIFVGLLVANAAISANAGRYALAGLTLGLGVGIKQWAAFGAGVLWRGRSLRGLLVGGSTFAVTVLLLYGPFFAFGDVETFHFDWGTRSGTFFAYLQAWTGASGWSLRLFQGAAAGLVGALLAGMRSLSPLVAVAGAIATRLLLDPLRLTYYSGPLVAVVVIWLWTSPTPGARRWRLPITCASPLVVLAPYLLSASVLWLAGSALLVTCVAAMVVAERHSASQDAVRDLVAD